MPGIAGVISSRPAPHAQPLIEAMLASMRHEPFYTSGTYAAPDLSLCVGWVALEGSFAAGQPALNAQGDIALIFAGECFADAKINKVSCLVDLYDERGDRFFEDLNGVFSGLLIDRRRRKAFLFNDRYGMERIYYHESADGFYFASEAKALLRVLPAVRALDSKGIAQLFEFGCTLGSQTLFRDVRLLPGGSLWSFDGRGYDKASYFIPATWEARSPLPAESFEASFEETFKRALPRYLESNSDIGISLTGGLDTRMIMACLPDAPGRLVTYTFGGEEGETVDARIAARVAAACGLPHRVLRIGRTFFSDFASLADRTVYATDGCLGVCGAHEMYLNRQARDIAPIRLTGNFGSEIFRGVNIFKPLGLPPDLLSPEYRSHLNGTGFGTPAHPVSFAAFKDIPWHLSGLAQAARSQVSTRTPYLDNDLVAIAFQTPVGLRRSSLPALHLVSRNKPRLQEIATDRGVMLEPSRLASRVRSLYGTLTFKLDYWYQEETPSWLSALDPHLSRLPARYWPFRFHGYLTYRRWFRRQLADYLRDRLADARTRQSPLWNHAFLDALAGNTARDGKSQVREINFVLTVDAIERLLLRPPCHRS